MALTVGEFKKRIQAAVDFNPRLTSDVMLRLIKDRIRDIAQETLSFKKYYDISVGTDTVKKEFKFETVDNIITCDKIEYGELEDFYPSNQTQIKLEKGFDYEFDFYSDLTSGVQGFVVRLKFEPKPNYYIRVITSNIPSDNDIDILWRIDSNIFTSAIPEIYID
ncbi:MAG: hypothetical protein ACUVQP_04925, partial [Bacteroidales bacterium]